VDGTLWAWGDNSFGELGQGTHTGKKSSPVQIAGSWIQASCGGKGYFAPWGMAIRSDRTLWTWGNGSSSPVQVTGGSIGSWTLIAAGDENWLGIQVDGTLWGCGSQGAGELGLGTSTTGYATPTQLGGSWTQVTIQADSSPGGSSAGIKVDGSLWTWGGNGDGDLGTGDTNEYNSPVQIGTYSWTQVSLSPGSHTLAIRADGTLWAWGANTNGQLGVGNTVSYSSPVQVPGQWINAFALGTSFGGDTGVSLAIRSDGTLWAWGDNTSGCVGVGSLVSYSSPVQVGTSKWTSLAGGTFTAFAIK
jgi:alpha-tubulin suppressor-like RCC1 family protein